MNESTAAFYAAHSLRRKGISVELAIPAGGDDSTALGSPFFSCADDSQFLAYATAHGVAFDRLEWPNYVALSDSAVKSKTSSESNRVRALNFADIRREWGLPSTFSSSPARHASTVDLSVPHASAKPSSSSSSASVSRAMAELIAGHVHDFRAILVQLAEKIHALEAVPAASASTAIRDELSLSSASVPAASSSATLVKSPPSTLGPAKQSLLSYLSLASSSSSAFMRRCHLPLINALAKLWLGAPLDQITLGDLRGRRLDLVSDIHSSASSTSTLRAAVTAVTASGPTYRASGHVCRMRSVTRCTQPTRGSDISEAARSAPMSPPSRHAILELVANSIKFGCAGEKSYHLIAFFASFAL